VGTDFYSTRWGTVDHRTFRDSANVDFPIDVGFISTLSDGNGETLLNALG
jgi:hypothetical protein